MNVRGKSCPKRRWRRAGLTLLEVLLSIAILGGAIATIGELIRVGSRSAARARDMTRAQLLAETKMAEITTGAVPLSSVTQTTFETDPDWLYTIALQPVDNNGLQSVTLLIEQNVEGRPTSYQLVRWIREEDLDFSEEVEETTGSGDSSGASGAGASGGSESSGGR